MRIMIHGILSRFKDIKQFRESAVLVKMMNILGEPCKC